MLMTAPRLLPPITLIRSAPPAPPLARPVPLPLASSAVTWPMPDGGSGASSPPAASSPWALTIWPDSRPSPPSPPPLAPPTRAKLSSPPEPSAVARPPSAPRPEVMVVAERVPPSMRTRTSPAWPVPSLVPP
jgi:hypothetical protein